MADDARINSHINSATYIGTCLNPKSYSNAYISYCPNSNIITFSHSHSDTRAHTDTDSASIGRLFRRCTRRRSATHR